MDRSRTECGVGKMVEEFHAATGMNVSTGDLNDQDLFELRCNLIAEEVSEMLNGLADKDPVEVLDGACDAVYVIAGTIVSYFGGEVFDEAFRRVHANNMTKIPADGRVKRREDGKILKPDTFIPVDLTDLV